MQIWVNSINPDLIKIGSDLGALSAIAPQFGLIRKSKRPLNALIESMLEWQKGAVAIPIAAGSASDIVGQAQALRKLSDRVIPKIAVTKEGLMAICALTKENIPTIATAIFDLNQVLLSARAGAAFLCPYFSGICQEEIEGIEALRGMLQFLRHYQFASKFIATSLESPEQVKECAKMGVDAVILNEKTFKELIQDHPMTLRAVELIKKDSSTL